MFREFICFFLLAAAKLDEINEGARWVSPNSEMLESCKEPRNVMNPVDGSQYEGQYKAISRKLEREIGSMDPRKNMVKIAEWYEEAQRKGIASGAYVEALEQLLSMNQISDTNRCNRDTYAILRKNDRATGGRTHKTHWQLPILSHLETVVDHFAWRHALACYPEYPHLFQVLRDGSLDSWTRNCVDTFTKPLIETSARNITELTNKQVASLAWDALDKLAHDDPDRQFLGRVVNERGRKLEVKSEQIQKLVRKYLVEPCQKYIEVMGPDVFTPYNYDRQLLDERDQKRYAAMDSKLLLEFSDGWLAYRLCKALVTDREASLPNFLTRFINESKFPLAKR